MESINVKEITWIKDAQKVLDPSESMLDYIERPKNNVEEYSEDDIRTECERITAVYLLRHGFELISFGWECSFGKIDIVAYDPEKQEPVLVNLKSARKLGEEFGIPELKVEADETKRLKKCALSFMTSEVNVDTVRCDVIAVEIIAQERAKLRHLVNACVIQSKN